VLAVKVIALYRTRLPPTVERGRSPVREHEKFGPPIDLLIAGLPHRVDLAYGTPASRFCA
jgi:hypothetical protein